MEVLVDVGVSVTVGIEVFVGVGVSVAVGTEVFVGAEVGVAVEVDDTVGVSVAADVGPQPLRAMIITQATISPNSSRHLGAGCLTGSTRNILHLHRYDLLT
jgi:hypothetical protein